MKTDRKIKPESGSEKLKIDKKPRSSRAKSPAATNGKIPLETYEHAPIGIVECSPDGKHINANEEFCRFLGYEKEELIGKSLKEITHEDDYPIDIKLHEQLVAGKIPFYRLEQRYLHKNGGSLWAELTRSKIRDGSGKPLYTIGVVLDISDRKHVERVLRESVERLRLATEAARMFTWELDLGTRIYTFADNFEQVLGFSAGLLPKNSVETVEQLSPAEDVQAFWGAAAKAIEQHSDLHSQQLRVIDPETGETAWLEVNAKIVYDDRGHAKRMFGVAQNITDKKKAQEEIFIISRMPEENPHPVMRLTQDGKVLYANHPSESLLKSWQGNAAQAIPDELRMGLAEALTSGVKKEIEIEYESKVFSATLAPILEAGYVNFYGNDITERKRAERALRDSEERFRALVNQATAGITQTDLHGQLTFANQKITEMLGYNRLELIGKTMQELTFARDWPQFQGLIEQLTQTGKPFEIEQRLMCRDGSTLWASLSISPLRDANANMYSTIAVIIDITERKHMEQALATERELLRRLFETMPVMVSIYDTETRSIRLNEEFTRLLGWKSEEVTVLSLLESLYPDPDYRAQILQRMAAVDGTNEWLEVQVQTRDRRELDSLWSNISISKDGQLVTGIALGIDITERKRAEEKLRQAAAFDEAVMGNMGEGLYTVDSDGKVMSMNPAAEKLFGWTLDELRGRRMHDVTHYKHPDGTPFPAEDCAGFQVLHHGQKLVGHEDVFIRKDGTFFDVIYSSSPLWENGKINGLVVVFSDNTIRKQAEKRLVLLSEISDLVRRSEDPNELLLAVSEALGDHFQAKRCLFNEIDLENDIEIVHRDYCRGVESVAGVHRISDYSSVTSAEMAAGKTVVNHDSKTDPRTASDYERSYVTYGERAYVTVPLMRKNQWVASLWLSDDTPRRWSKEDVSLLETIAERTWIAVEKLRINAALRDSEEQLQVTFNTAVVGFATLSLDTRFMEVNDAFCQIVGYSREELLGMDFSGLTHPDYLENTFNEVSKLIQGHLPSFELEKVYVRKDGKQIWVQNSVSVVRDVNDKPLHLIAICQDVSERKHAEEALLASEQRFREIFETAGVSVWLEDFTQVKTTIESLRIQGVEDFRTYFAEHPEVVQSAVDLVRILDVNNETLGLFGAGHKEDLLGSLSNVFAPETEQIFVEELVALAEGRETLRAETQVRTLEGKPISVLFTVHFAPPTVDQSHVVVTLTDITERKRAEEALRASEALYRTIARSIPGGGVYVVDKDMRYIVADGSVTASFGMSREMLEGYTVSEVLQGEQSARMIDRLKRNFAGETLSYETEHNGHVYWTQQAPLSESIEQAIIVTLDITERKRAEEALRQSEARFVQFMEHLPGLAWIKDMQGRYVYANAAAEEVFNTPREKLYGKTDQEIFPPEVANQFRMNDEQALLGEKGIQVVETLQQKDGILHYSLVNKFPIPGPDGKTALIGGTAFDITERKRAEDALQESEERLRAILRQATAGIVRKDAEGRLLFVNQAYCNMLGYTESELLGKPFWEFMHEGDIQENKRLYSCLMTEGVPFKLEKRLIRQDGSLLWVDVSVSPIMDGTGRPQSAVAVEVDITARKQAEEALQSLNLQLESRVVVRTAELQQANHELLESRRRLQILSQRLVEVQEEERRAIARELHDRVGQTLSALNINLIIMRGQILPDSLERVGPRFNDSMQLVGETITLVRDVMSNLRPAVLDDYGLEAALQSHVDEYMSRYEIKAIFQRPAQPIPRLGPSIEMTFLRIAQEALMNIARHANASQVALSLWQEGDSVCMTIQDNGSGIVSWQQANRPGSHGLTIMRERAEAFGGNLKVGSVPGKGTKIEMSIPLGKSNQNDVQKERLE